MVRHLPQSEIYWVPGSPTGIQGPLIRVQFLNLGLNQRLKICETYENKKASAKCPKCKFKYLFDQMSYIINVQHRYHLLF